MNNAPTFPDDFAAQPCDAGDLAASDAGCGGDAAAGERDASTEVATVAEGDAIAADYRALDAQFVERTRELARRSRELVERTRELDDLHRGIERRFLALVKVLTDVVEARFPGLRTVRIAAIAKRAANELGLPAAECDHIGRAALLHPIGRVGLSDSMLATHPDQFTHEQVQAWRAYPGDGADILSPLVDLAAEARIVRSHCERYDGQGFPDGLSGDSIPIGARLLAAAILFDQLLGDSGLDDTAAIDDAIRGLARRSEKRIDPRCCEAIVAVFRISANPRSNGVGSRERHVETQALSPGMVLSRDAIAASGTLLLSAGHELTATIIAQLQAFEQRHGTPLRLWIGNAPHARSAG